MNIQRWTVADPARMSVVPAQEGDLVTYADHLAAMAEARIEWGMSNGPALDFARGYAAGLAQAREAIVSQHGQLSREERYDNAGGFCEALAAIDGLIS